MNLSITPSTLSLANARGKIQYNMTNDYMFRAVLQKNKKVLAGLVGSLLHLDPEKLDVEITNPIILGQAIGDKEFMLDIHVTVNGQMKLNLEMQVLNYGNWKERSLSYLCRSFDNLSKGSNYIDVVPAVQIGFIDFTLFEDAPEFYATYKMENVKNHRIYTDKMWLSVVELNSIELATEEDRRYQIDQWAKLFKARTWEELKSMASANQYMESAANTIYELSVDETVQEQCRRWAEYEYYQKRREEQIAEFQQENTRLKQENADKDAEIAELKRKLAEVNGE
ncbi:MAG: Rpn family recombination-promoting nuclease/putative transposase [Lachnospiraceae bacterium]|nr:Rpn family recombination-promoting nuclease/putative transposase [Lachnospiraceae bacterium]